MKKFIEPVIKNNKTIGYSINNNFVLNYIILDRYELKKIDLKTSTEASLQKIPPRFNRLFPEQHLIEGYIKSIYNPDQLKNNKTFFGKFNYYSQVYNKIFTDCYDNIDYKYLKFSRRFRFTFRYFVYHLCCKYGDVIYNILNQYPQIIIHIYQGLNNDKLFDEFGNQYKIDYFMSKLLKEPNNINKILKDYNINIIENLRPQCITSYLYIDFKYIYKIPYNTIKNQKEYLDYIYTYQSYMKEESNIHYSLFMMKSYEIFTYLVKEYSKDYSKISKIMHEIFGYYKNSNSIKIVDELKELVLIGELNVL